MARLFHVLNSGEQNGGGGEQRIEWNGIEKDDMELFRFMTEEMKSQRDGRIRVGKNNGASPTQLFFSGGFAFGSCAAHPSQSPPRSLDAAGASRELFGWVSERKEWCTDRRGKQGTQGGSSRMEASWEGPVPTCLCKSLFCKFH